MDKANRSALPTSASAAAEDAHTVAHHTLRARQSHGQTDVLQAPGMPAEERRRMLAKQAKSEAEHAKVGVRSARKEANDEVKKLEASDDMKKSIESDIQQLTDRFVKKTDVLFDKKRIEIMTV